WVVIAAQNALQGALVCALSNTDRLGALRPDLQKRWRTWGDNGEGDAPDRKLADFKTLLKWGCDAPRMSFMGGKPLGLTDAQLQELEWRHDGYRNDFSHFTPMGWSIDLSRFPRMVLTAVETA